MSNYTDLTADNLLEITDQLDDQTLLSYCQTNKEIAALCDHKVWLHRIFTQGLAPLLPYAVLYPSLKEFYLNIRHDALYEVAKDYIENGRDKYVNEYYVNVKDVYDALKIPINQRYTALILRINNKKYNINYRNKYASIQYDDEQPFVISFEEILQFPDLEPRSLVIIGEYVPYHVNAKSLRDLHTIMIYDSIYVQSVGPLHDIDSEFVEFKYGFYDVQIRGRKLLVLLDGSLVDSSNSTDSNYYVVIAPDPIVNKVNIYRGLGNIRSADEVDSSLDLLKYLEEYGTYYKLEDLATLLRQLN